MLDNFYTTANLAWHMFERYGWTLVGTVVPTDKKTRVDNDNLFCKLSNGAKNEVKHGWFREAVLWCLHKATNNITFRPQLGMIKSRSHS